MYAWRELFRTKYSSLPGVRKLHDFLIVRTHNNNYCVVMKAREKTYNGAWTNSPLHVLRFLPEKDARGQRTYLTDDPYQLIPHLTLMPQCQTQFMSPYVTASTWYVRLLLE